MSPRYAIRVSRVYVETRIYRQKAKSTHLVKSMATLGNDMRFLSGQTKAEGEGFEADGTLLLFL